MAGRPPKSSTRRSETQAETAARLKKNEYARNWRAQNPDRARHHMLTARYGISLADYERLLDAQGGCCAICGTRDWGSLGPNVDHDHETGLVRGILCKGCNTGIALFDEDPDRMRLAIRYVEMK